MILAELASQTLQLYHLVLLCTIILLGRKLLDHHRQRKADEIVVRRHGCESPPELSTRWPLGIDRMTEIWKANADGHLLAYLCSIAKKYDPHTNLCQYLVLGPRVYDVRDPENLKTVLSTNFNDYGLGSRPSVFSPLMRNSIFTQDGSAWKHSRELLKKHFGKVKQQDIQPFKEHVESLITCLGDGGVVDLQALLFDLTLDTASAALFGQSVYNLRSGIDQAETNRDFARCFDIVQDGLAKRFRLAPLHFLYQPAGFRQACRQVHAFVEERIRERNNAVESPSDTGHSNFLHQLSERSASDEDLRDQLLGVLFAARDTTACCLSWTMRLLVRHPACLARLRQEVETIARDNSNVSRKQLCDMKFLACVVKESLRLCPPVPLNSREAVRPTMLPTGGGKNGDKPILVRKGEAVISSQYLTSRNQSIYGNDAEDFRPERWETGELANIGWAYFPFHKGPRRRLGEDFALMEVSYTIVRMLQTFEVIELPEGEPDQPIGTERQRVTLVLSPTDGCRVRIQR